MNLQEIKAILAALAAYYQTKLSSLQLSMYAEDLKTLSAEELKLAVINYRRNPKNTRFPLPSTLIAQSELGLDPSVEAVAIMNRIWAAISTCGYTDVSKLARRKVGEVGWSVVQSLGGWSNVCHESNSTDAGVFKAQLRETIRTELELKNSMGSEWKVQALAKNRGLTEEQKISNFLTQGFGRSLEADPHDS